MYTMMIVDDELLARDVLKATIRENFSEISEIIEAVNGNQAIELNRRCKPDIILMDIRIPGMNGIEASRQILLEDPRAVILIITAYGDFTYIQQALDMGIKGYLLKPVKDEEMIEKINKCIKFISESKSSEDVNKKIEKTIRVIKPIIQKEIVSAIITGSGADDEVKSYIHFLQENMEAGYFMLLSYDMEPVNRLNHAVRNKIMRDKIHEICSNFIPLFRNCLFGEMLGNIQTIFFPIDSGAEEKDILRESLMIGENIKSKIKVMTNIEIGIGIGNIYKGLENFKHSYDEAMVAMRKADGKKEVLHFKNLKLEFTARTVPYPVRLENELLESIRLGNSTRAAELADEFLEYLFGNLFHPDQIKDYICQLVSILNRTILQMGSGSVFIESMGNFSELFRISNPDEIKIWYKRYINSIIGTTSGLKTASREKQIVGKMKEYINRNFSSEITLENVAEEIGMGSSYISRLFKEELGINFIDYITGLRMEQAKEMLASGEKNIKIISDAVGYSDVNYFCRVFKKLTGLTTSQYRLQNLDMTDGSGRRR